MKNSSGGVHIIPAPVAHDSIHWKLNRGLSPQKIQQHSDTISRWHHACHNPAKPFKSAARDLNLFANLNRRLYNPHAFCTDQTLQVLNRLIRHHWPEIAKMHDSRHSERVPHRVQRTLPIEAREQVARKHRLRYAYWPPSSSPPKTDARIHNLDPLELLQIRRRNVLAAPL